MKFLIRIKSSFISKKILIIYFILIAPLINLSFLEGHKKAYITYFFSNEIKEIFLFQIPL